MKQATFFISSTRRIFTKLLAVSVISIKIKPYIGHLPQKKTFVQRRGCAISSKLKMLQRFKGTVMQIEKGIINDRLRVLNVF